MLPLTIKQYQSTARMQRLSPRLEELKRQYGTDKQRLNEETMKLYQEENVNPMGSCLPMLIQLPIIMSLYQVITRPLQFMIGKTAEQIGALETLYKTLSGAVAQNVQQMQTLNFFKLNPAFMDQARQAGLLADADLINMRFLGLDLSMTPTYSPELLFGPDMLTYLPLLLVPLIGVVSTYISSKISMASTAQSAQGQQPAGMGKSMMLMGPIMTLIFSFSLPAGVITYWIAGYLIQIVQQLYINKYILKIGMLGNHAPPNAAIASARAKPAAGAAGAAGGKRLDSGSGNGNGGNAGSPGNAGETDGSGAPNVAAGMSAEPIAIGASGASGAQAIAGGIYADNRGQAPGKPNAGQRSNTNRNYGSTKRKKKK
jgi:YidC/Oxa1 family membrane protein insertase